MWPGYTYYRPVREPLKITCQRVFLWVVALLSGLCLGIIGISRILDTTPLLVWLLPLSMIIIFGSIAMAIIFGVYWLEWSRWRKFRSSAKGTAQAIVVDQKTVTHMSGESDSYSYSYVITYTFQIRENEVNRTFRLTEDVDWMTYKDLPVDTSLTVEYAVTDPRLARRRPMAINSTAEGTPILDWVLSSAFLL
jgi:hypothetical protein